MNRPLLVEDTTLVGAERRFLKLDGTKTVRVGAIESYAVADENLAIQLTSGREVLLRSLSLQSFDDILQKVTPWHVSRAEHRSLTIAGMYSRDTKGICLHAIDAYHLTGAKLTLFLSSGTLKEVPITSWDEVVSKLESMYGPVIAVAQPERPKAQAPINLPDRGIRDYLNLPWAR